jgi:hypothetical protein
VANRKLGGNVQKLGVCRPIASPHTIRTVPGETYRHGQVIPAISATSSLHGQNKNFYCFFQNGKTRYLVSNFLLLFPEWKNPLFGEQFFTAFSRMEKPVIW